MSKTHMQQEKPDDCLPEAARRALAEAKERTERVERDKTPAPKEILGRDGPDPVRYGDWEKDGIISDF